MRKIIHTDMDAFYAAIEQRDNPDLRGKAIAVAGASRRAVVMTASYDARRFGVHSAMPVFKARRLCPDLIVVPARFAAYREASAAMRTILRQYSEIIEVPSLDEAYLDVTEPLLENRPAMDIAAAIRDEIAATLRVTASAGVSFNKFLAKLASASCKPDGVRVIRPHQSRHFLAELPVERFHGVGPAMARRMKASGLAYGRDLQAIDERTARERLGPSGAWFWNLAQGVDDRPVQNHRARKSLSIETTFLSDIEGYGHLATAIGNLADELHRRCERAEFFGRTLTLKVKFSDFRIRSRSRSLGQTITDLRTIAEIADRLLRDLQPMAPVRLIGLGVSRSLADEKGSDRQIALPLDLGNHTDQG